MALSANIVPDIHPDGFYKAYSSTDLACHSGNGSAGILGAEMSDCDTPFSLVNATFQWIKDNLKDEIDFVIWTGDSARHDNDEDIPRTEKQIVELNKMVVHKFVEVFGKDENLGDPDPTNDFVVPIVPNFGNNDILPHNIFEPGPNRWTRDYADIWEKFIPEAQRHSFARGGWFFTEVIPNKLAVFSLNTIYFFDSNSAVDGCDAKTEPGYEHMEWLRVQLQFLRERGMKAIMIGHVPPARTESKQSWDETCWQKYTLWMRQYRDVIVSGMFGHMNVDHFMFQDTSELKYNIRGELEEQEIGERNATDPMFSVQSKAEYMLDLREGWTRLPTPPPGWSYSDPVKRADDEKFLENDQKAKNSKQDQEKKFLNKIGGKWAERFSLTIVSPSVVPNYYPTLRIVEYNITGMENEHPAVGESQPETMEVDFNLATDQESAQFAPERVDDDALSMDNIKASRRSSHKKKKPPKLPFEMPKPPSSTAPPGPAYSPQPFTLTSYTQYFANLSFINHDFEESGLTLEEYIGTSCSPKHQDTGTRVRQARKFAFEVEYDTKTDKRYKMPDMTVRSYLNLAHRIVKASNEETHGRETGKHLLDVLPDGSIVDLGDSEASVGKKDSKGGEPRRETETYKKEKKKHKNKKKKKHHHKDHKDTLWHTFIKRAFVMTKTDEDMDDFDPEEHQQRSGGV
jgi:endopolyphosphatase